MKLKLPIRAGQSRKRRPAQHDFCRNLFQLGRSYGLHMSAQHMPFAPRFEGDHAKRVQQVRRHAACFQGALQDNRFNFGALIGLDEWLGSLAHRL